MKINGVPGDHAFHALCRPASDRAWELTIGYFFNQKEVMESYQNYQVIWPIEVREDGTIYVPDQSELE